MNSDIVDLKTFYATLLGRLAERSIAMALSSIWNKLPEERLMGLGYALPWLDRFGPDAERAFAMMPARQGAVCWPSGRPSSTVLVFEEELPLPDAALDRILLVHALEHAENPEQMLLELWRVLAPGGRLVIVVPNRRGLWARFEHTPFGTGRPYSRAQLVDLLREANFTPGAWADSLHFPPARRRWVMRLHKVLERAGRRFWPLFAGVLVVEAEKRLHQGIPAMARRFRRVLVPALAPQGAAGVTPRAAASRRASDATGETRRFLSYGG
ncbi:methyltransferase domain-containing protein [Chelativorans sp. Marseille-P2723]|uniref:class I SAM-dependent methyltransferase n=1 Tax=Chelativorans sp. Marseille-P2723 TaxID=2709133 RepID=UPI001570CD95|nr:methyltransferase domain-containing protein [Chelativorans sp. Marseille-P2723]